MEGRKFPVNAKELPRTGLTNEEQVQSALDHNLDATAKEAYRLMQSPTISQEEFIDAVAAFNALPRESRGYDRYDHGRPIIDNIDRSLDLQSPRGYPYTATQKKDGTIEFSTTLH